MINCIIVPGTFISPTKSIYGKLLSNQRLKAEAENCFKSQCDTSPSMSRPGDRGGQAPGSHGDLS